LAQELRLLLDFGVYYLEIVRGDLVEEPVLIRGPQDFRSKIPTRTEGSLRRISETSRMLSAEGQMTPWGTLFVMMVLD
jgi:hypothetical protein